MYRSRKTSLTEDKFLSHTKTPSFSSSLLDQIYSSIEESDTATHQINSHPHTLPKKQSLKQSTLFLQEDEMAKEIPLRAWTDKSVSEKHITHVRSKPTEMDKKLHRRHGSQDAIFYTSTSSSSDSSCGGFSSSDTESMFGIGSAKSCFAPQRPKPVKTSVSDKNERRHSSQIYGHREVHHAFDDYHHNPNTTTTNNEGLIKSKSRALKIYNNLKNIKQPISPGGKLTNFLNSLFNSANSKKSKTYGDSNAERTSKSGQASVSACSSASSFSRSCLSKPSPSTRHKLQSKVQRSVHFCPVSVIVDEENRPCGQKYLYGQNNHNMMMPLSMPTAWKIGGRSPQRNKKIEGEMVKSERKNKKVEEVGRGREREILKEYLQSQKMKSDLRLMDLPLRTKGYEDDDEDDAASYSSSDLFELDHLAVLENRYREELPVYETTHVRTNRAIANGLIM